MMGWTTKPPTKPGFYYWQGGYLINKEVALVQVSAYMDKDKSLLAQELCINGYKNAPNDGSPESWGGRWAGPMPQPEECR